VAWAALSLLFARGSNVRLFAAMAPRVMLAGMGGAVLVYVISANAYAAVKTWRCACSGRKAWHRRALWKNGLSEQRTGDRARRLFLRTAGGWRRAA